METQEQVWAKYQKAVKNKENNGFMDKLREAYKYCCPRRHDQDLNPETEIFDSTAIHAVQSRVASNHDALFPAFRDWIGEEPVLKIDKGQERHIKQQLEERALKAHTAIELSNFHVEIEDTLTDALFSDGALLVFSGTAECPFRFQAVDWNSFYTLDDLNGEPTNNFLKRTMSFKAAKYNWPKADFSEIGEYDENKIFEIIDGYTYDEFSEKYTYSVFFNGKRIFHKEEKSSPWVIFNPLRKITVKNGWGQVMDTMPSVKTANQVIEYLLKHAAINLAGIWQYDDDGVINPHNVSLKPGALIARAAGSKGLEPLHSKLDMNLTQFILSDQKEDIKKAIQGSALPDFNSGVRTASEYQLRDAEMKKTEIPIMLQLAQSSKRLIRRLFDILESNAMKASSMYCEKLTDKNGKIIATSFTSPLIRMRKQLQMSKSMQTMMQAAQIFGQAAYDVVNQDKFLRDYYLANDFSAEHVRNEEDVQSTREENRKNDIELAQAGVNTVRPTPGNVKL